ncbi:hypothetical protein HNY73_004874 [Argiope bruennichi]|uniref:DUF4708 domain-containing protein n=1 Tax=Argiope bruennichi TaxID=94029 RepID=A0A8T0FQK2_ARGBR|nr:hypothetical protein HNY73_004874 [Argiope bruennichi]
MQKDKIHCSDFLISEGPLNGVRMEIFVTHREISLCLQPTCVKLPMVKVLHMKQGMITAVSKIPQITKSFNNYSEIQKYWKDMYGYLLPIVPEERIKYFNVVFRIPNAIPYTNGNNPPDSLK